MSDKTTYIGFGNDTLQKLPKVEVGHVIKCEWCGEEHALCGDDSGLSKLMFYRCGERSYLGAVDGRLVIGQKPDVVGEL